MNQSVIFNKRINRAKEANKSLYFGLVFGDCVKGKLFPYVRGESTFIQSCI